MKMREVSKAEQRLTNVVHHTPLVKTRCFSEMAGAEIYLKCEHQQKTGSYKVRGAYNKIAKLCETREITHVVTASAGNHSQGVAYAARALGIKATIVMPRTAPIAKIQATENYGATVVLHGDGYDEACKKAFEICDEMKATFIHPFDDKDVMAGQGTVGLEIVKEINDLDMVIVPVGGGGLLAGVAFTIKSINPDIQVIGVQASRADAMVQSFKSKKYIELDSIYTIADGIAVKSPGKITYPFVCEYVDDMVTVSDEDIASTIIYLMERTKQVVEPAGAVSLAAVINKRIDVKGKKVACILSGGNIDVGFIHKIIEKGLLSRGRQIKFSVLMKDKPGNLTAFSKIVSDLNANVISVHYDRTVAELHLNEVILHVVCEVSSFEHANEIEKNLVKEGFEILKNGERM